MTIKEQLEKTIVNMVTKTGYLDEDNYKDYQKTAEACEAILDDIAIKYGIYLQKHCKPSLDTKHKYDWFDIPTTKHYTHKELFSHYKKQYMINKLNEQIWERYGNFELSHVKNEGIVENIEEFVEKVAVAFAQWREKWYAEELAKFNLIPYSDVKKEAAKTLMNKFHNLKELFQYFKENVYGKD